MKRSTTGAPANGGALTSPASSSARSLGGTAVLLLAIGGTLLVSAIRRGHEATPFAAFVVMGFALLLSLLFGYGSIRLINQGRRGH